LQDIPNTAKSTTFKPTQPLQVKFTKKIKLKDASTNTDESFSSKSTVLMEEIQESVSTENEPEAVDGSEDDRELDESFNVSESESEINEELSQHVPSNDCVLTEKKYIVSLISLKSLLVICEKCKRPAHITLMSEKGTLLTVNLLCEKNHETVWPLLVVLCHM